MTSFRRLVLAGIRVIRSVRLLEADLFENPKYCGILMMGYHLITIFDGCSLTNLRYCRQINRAISRKRCFLACALRTKCIILQIKFKAFRVSISSIKISEDPRLMM